MPMLDAIRAPAGGGQRRAAGERAGANAPALFPHDGP